MAVLVPTCGEAAAAALTRSAVWAGGPPLPARPVQGLPGEDVIAGRVPLRQLGRACERHALM
jgi:hypothetical protein